MTSEAQRKPVVARVPVYNDPKYRAIFYQVVVVLLVVWCAWQFAINAKANLEAQRIATGFGFFDVTAGFGINQSLIPYQEADTYGRAFVVGLLNTLLVAVVGVFFATIVGFVVGIARLSPNWIVARIAGGYVELIRNLPLLFQLLFWYIAVLGTLPNPRQSLGIGLQPLVQGLADGLSWLERWGLPFSLSALLNSLAAWIGPPAVYLSNRGLIAPQPYFHEGAGIVIAAFIVAVIAAIALRIWAKRRQEATGQTFPVGWSALGLIIGVPLIVLIVLGFPIGFDTPELRGFNFVGGMRMIPEFVALMIALTLYTAAFIAEVVRAGILAVSRGQTEAGVALGLRRSQVLRLIVVPQALRVIVPPLTNQYLNLTKNSTLGAAVGYPDLFSVFAGTALNITGQAIEIIAVTMAVYLFISLVTSGLMSIYNARIQLKER